MCLVQRFYFAACGHDRIEEELCEYAKSMDNPFFYRRDCPDFHSERCVSVCRCGLARYYCGQTTDGKFLDRNYIEALQSRAAIGEVDNEIVAWEHRWVRFIDEAAHHNMPTHVLQQTAKFATISVALQAYKDTKQQLVERMADAAAIVQHGADHYEKWSEQMMADSGGASIPAFTLPEHLVSDASVELICDSLLQLTELATAVDSDSIMEFNAAGIALSDHPWASRLPDHLAHLQKLPTIQLNSTNSRITLCPHQQSATPEGHAPLQGLADSQHVVGDHHNQQRQTAHPPSPFKRRHLGPRNRDGWRMWQQDGDDRAVRRSTRLQNKNINYAKSHGSLSSRECLPAKSVTSRMSPNASSGSTYTSQQR